MKAMMVRFGPRTLEQLLQLPRGSMIDSVEAPAAQPGVLVFRVRGAGFSVKPGERIPEATGSLHMLPATERIQVVWDHEQVRRTGS